MPRGRWRHITGIGDHRKLDNAAGAFMPVVVKIVNQTTDGYRGQCEAY